MTRDGRQQSPDLEYLLRIEALAKAVTEEAGVEGWLTFIPEDDCDQSSLQRAVNELARNLKFVHYDGDGCFDH